MKRKILLGLLGICFSTLSMAQIVEYSFNHNNPDDVSKLLILVEAGIDGGGKDGLFVADINLGAIARYTFVDNIDFQAKIRKSISSFHFDPAYRKNFEIEGLGAIFFSDNVKQKMETVEISSKERGNTITVNYFDTNLPQRNLFGVNGGINYKTVGINPTETYDNRTGEGYNGIRENVNFSSVSIIGGIQFKRINASVIKLKNYRNYRVFDNYIVMTLDGIFSPINTFTDGITGENVGKEIKDEGFRKSLPFGGRFTCNMYSSLPASDGAKKIRYTVSSSIGYRAYLGFHYDFGLGLMVFRSR